MHGASDVCHAPAVRQDSKLKHMTDMQLSVVSEGDSRQELTSQLTSYDDSLERLHCEQFRLRCYMASLQGGELPNPKVTVPTALLHGVAAGRRADEPKGNSSDCAAT